MADEPSHRARVLSRRPFSAVIAALLMAPVLVVGAAAPAGASGTPLYPDLKTLPPRDLRLDRADITANLSGNFHNVLRFSNTTLNTGQGPLIVNAQIDPATRSGPSTQRVMNSDGTFSDTGLNNTVYWHEAHHHYHFDHWGSYQLWTKSGYDAWIASGRTSGAPSYVGAKTTSCIIDEEFIAQLPGTPYPGPYGLSGCDVDGSNRIHMGLSAGWGDTYDYYRQDQWIDLNQDTLGNGTWVLRSVADPTNIVYESAGKGDGSRESAQDNEATTTLVVSGGSIVDSNAPTGSVLINNVAATTSSTTVTIKVIGRDDRSGVNQFRLSNNGTNWSTFNYTSSGSVPTTVSFNLADAATGGSGANGIRTVYAQTHDNSGKWGATFTDTIDLENGGGGGPPPPPPPTTTYSQLIRNDGPAGYWRLDETSGTTAADSAGSNPGTYQGGVTLGATGLLTSESDKAASFSGSQTVRGDVDAAVVVHEHGVGRGMDQAVGTPGRGRVRVGGEQARVVLVAVLRLATGIHDRAERHIAPRCAPQPVPSCPAARTTLSGPTTARRNACTSTATRLRPSL